MSEPTAVEDEARSRSGVRRLLLLLAAAQVTTALAVPGRLANPAAEWLFGESGLDQESAMIWVGTLGMLSVLPMPVLALLSDLRPWRGSRRIPWLLLTAGAGLVLWPVLAITPTSIGLLLGLQGALGVSLLGVNAVARGLAADLGQEHRVTGTVSAVWIIAGSAAGLVALALIPVLDTLPLLWIGLGSAALLALFVLLVRTLPVREPRRSEKVPGARSAFRAMARSRWWWWICLVFLIFGLAQAATRSWRIYLHFAWGGAPEALEETGAWQGALVAGGLAYLWLCRRYRLRYLLLGAVALLAGATAFAALQAPTAGDWVLTVHGLAVGLTALPLMDLAFRVVEPGLEAFGLTLLGFFSALGSSIGPMVMTILALADMPGLLPPALLVAMSLLAVLPILVLPGALVDRREGEG